MSHISIGSILPVGTIIHSMLTTTQFATQYGDNWVLADGRSVTGTLYASVTGLSTIPDMRGAFLRAKDHGVGRNADGDTSLGAYSDDKFESHVHQQKHSNGVTDVLATRATGAGGGIYNPIPGVGDLAGGVVVPQTTATTGSNETSPKSITVNIFIRIN